MYKKFFGLRDNPFNINPDPRFLFQTRDTGEVLAGLTYGIQKRQGFILLTGEVGTGKTTLLNHLLQWLQVENVDTSFVPNPRLNPAEFLDFMMADFGIPCDSGLKSRVLLHLNHWLLELYRSGQTAVLVVDEAQNLSTEVLEEIRLLTNLETSTEKLLQIVLSGQPELEEKLKQPQLRQLRQRISVRLKIRPLTGQEVRGYIAERLRIAGGDGQLIFTPEAAGIVDQYAQGIPRVINMLCEHALITAYAEQRMPVTAEIIEQVARQFELDVTAPRARPSPCDASEDDAPRNAIAGTPQTPEASAKASQRLSMKPSDTGKSDHVRNLRWQLGEMSTDWEKNLRGRSTESVQDGREGTIKSPLVESIPKPPDARPTTDKSSSRVNLSRAPAALNHAHHPQRKDLFWKSRSQMVWIALTLMLFASIGLWVAFQMKSEVHSVSQTATPSQPAADLPPAQDISTHPSDASSADTMPSAPAEGGAPATTESSPVAESLPDPRVLRGESPSKAVVSDGKLLRTREVGIKSNPRGSTASRKGLDEKAAPRFQSPDRNLSPNQKVALKDNLAIAAFFMDRNDYSAAIDAFNAALKIDPSGREAQAGLQRARQRLGAQKTSTRP